MSTKKVKKNFFLNLRPVHRVALSFAFALLAWFFTRNLHFKPLLILVFLWDVFALAYIIPCWIIFFKRPASEIRNIARQEDGSRFFVFIAIMVSSFASMFTVLLLIVSKETSQSSSGYYLPIAITGMLLSWFIVHTTFAFHYAHLYYDDAKENPSKHAAGLSFPEEDAPDYLDFAYFSFVLGMTFQVSDVEISGRTLRRTALVHSLLSFGLNTFVVALTINIIAGLQQ